MYNRNFAIPKDNFFLFGPRSTGKSTWLKHCFEADVYIDLLRSENYFELIQNPEQLRARLLALKSKKKIKVVIDEIQRVPQLLNEIHALIEDYPNRFLFSLTGSSARKLRKGESNLLAGRCLTRKFFPFVFNEVENDFSLDQALMYGMLPRVFTTNKSSDKEDILRAYTETYLKEEIQQEALVRKLPDYVKFLKHLAISNGQTINLSNISREAGISRAPLENYMSIICDTLIGVTIEPIHLKSKVKEISTPKIYFFDCGVVNALSGNLGEKPGADVGHLFETLVLSELRAYSEYSLKNYEISYWATPSNSEVDFIISKGKRRIGIEVKAGKKWKSEYANGLNILLLDKKIQKAIVVYTGQNLEKHEQIDLLPFQEFCKLLYNGEII